MLNFKLRKMTGGVAGSAGSFSTAGGPGSAVEKEAVVRNPREMDRMRQSMDDLPEELHPRSMESDVDAGVPKELLKPVCEIDEIAADRQDAYEKDLLLLKVYCDKNSIWGAKVFFGVLTEHKSFAERVKVSDE